MSMLHPAANYRVAVGGCWKAARPLSSDFSDRKNLYIAGA